MPTSPPDPHDWREFEGGYPWPHLDLPCRKHPDSWDTIEDDPALAQALCAGCPVVEACLTYALEHTIYCGILGGTTGDGRRRTVRLLRKRAG